MESVIVRNLKPEFAPVAEKGSSPFFTYLTSNDRQTNYGTTTEKKYPDANISRSVRHLNGVYTQRYNS